MGLAGLVVVLLVNVACQGMFDSSTPDDGGVDGEPEFVVYPCEGVRCSEHGVCDDRSGEALCVCFPGYHAEELECVADSSDGDGDTDIDADADADADADEEIDADADVDPDVEHPVPGDWVVVSAGVFVMGSPEHEEGRDLDETQHEVHLTHDFEMLSTEVTQTQFETLMGYNPSRFSDCSNCPVERVSWNEAAAYCNALSDEAGLNRCYECSGEGIPVRCSPSLEYGTPYGCPGFRLPTEAEFEYAARAHTTGPSYGDLDTVAWHAGNSGGETHEVAGLEPNGYRLYDILGNVWEWCHDLYGEYPSGPVTDPHGPATGSLRVFRGGSWYRLSNLTRAASRNSLAPGTRYGNIGVRPIRTR